MEYMKNKELYEKACQFMPGGVNSASRVFPVLFGSNQSGALFVDAGNGCFVTDVDGNIYIDYSMCSGAALFGHKCPRVVESIQRQLRSGISFSASSRLEYEVAAKVAELFPSVEMIRFCNSGSEAIQAAIGLARKHNRKRGIIRFDGCYHGWIPFPLRWTPCQGPF